MVAGGEEEVAGVRRDADACHSPVFLGPEAVIAPGGDGGVIGELRYVNRRLVSDKDLSRLVGWFAGFGGGDIEVAGAGRERATNPAMGFVGDFVTRKIHRPEIQVI